MKETALEVAMTPSKPLRTVLIQPRSLRGTCACAQPSALAGPRARVSRPAPHRSRSRRQVQVAAGDDDPLDLIGPFVDLGDLGVAHETFHGEVPDVAVAAQDLDRVDGHLHG